MTEFRIRRPRKLLNWFRRFWRKLVSAAVVAIGVLAFAFVLARVAAPFIISTGLVRNGIERAISQWTGHQAVIDGAPQVVFWPNPRITLADVTIEDPTADPPRRVAHIDSMSASFNLVKALVGNLKFNNFRFQRPHLYLRRDEKGALAWAGRGLFGAALSAVRPGPDGTQTLDATFNPSIGALTVEDGTLDIDDAFGGRVTLGGISADIDWPRLGDPAKAYVLARLGNQDVKLDLASSQPLMLLAGQNGNLMVKLQSQTLSGRFEGVANLAQEAYLAGAVELSTPDIPGLLAWRGAQLPAATHLKAASLTCNVLASGGGVRLNNLSFTIDQTSATGALEFNVNAGKAPKLTGTLAFNQMDIRSALSALSITLPNGARPHPAPEGNGLIEQVDIDLRLSAQTASFGPLEARHIGASILSGGGKTSFDIGDSEFEGGQLIAHFGTTRGIGGGGDLDVTIRDADLAATAEKLAISGPLPLGTGSLDVDLSTSRPLWETTATDVSGSAKLYVTSGTIPRLDAAAFRTPHRRRQRRRSRFRHRRDQSRVCQGLGRDPQCANRRPSRHPDADGHGALRHQRHGAGRHLETASHGYIASRAAILRRRLLARSGDLAGLDLSQRRTLSLIYYACRANRCTLLRDMPTPPSSPDARRAGAGIRGAWWRPRR